MNKLTTTLLAGVAVVGFSSSALAADLIIRDDFVERGVVHVDTWSGAYIGGHVGWGWAHVDIESEHGDIDDIDTYTAAGFLIGGQIGANVQMDALVLGVVGDLAWTNITGDSGEDADEDILGTNIHWIGTVRGKLGFATDMFMLYGTAGVAFAGVEQTLYDWWPDVDRSIDGHRFGWVAGIGAEAMVADNVSIFGEVLYHDFGTVDFEFDGDEDGTHALNVTTAKVGVNFHF
jgi:outer membrane immunogenic protein